MSEPTVCTYCKHVYIKPCNGREDCPNRVWLDEAQRKKAEVKEEEEKK